MLRVLHTEHDLSDRFISHVLARNIRVEEDLVDQTLQLEREAAGPGVAAARPLWQQWPAAPAASGASQISQETLAEMVGTTRSRVNFFMNKFRKLGFID